MIDTTQELTLTQMILLRATELINVKENWIKGVGYARKGDDPCGRYCALGALDKAYRELCGNESLLLYTEVYKAVLKHLPPGYVGIESYNDASTTTHDDIKELFCRTLHDELGEGAPNGDNSTSQPTP